VKLSCGDERFFEGETLLVPVGATAMSHFFFEAIGHLPIFQNRVQRLLFLCDNNRAFGELAELAGYQKEDILFRDFTANPDDDRDCGECWVFEKLIAPFYLYAIHPQLVPVFDRIAAAVDKESGSDFLYISRFDARHWRVLLNEEQVADRLSNKGFRVVNCGELSEQEKVAAFKGARVVVGPVGAGLYNALFSTEKPFILGLNGGTYEYIMFQDCVAIKEQPYGLFLGPEFLSYDPNGHQGRHNDFVLDITQLEKRIDTLLETFK
jgi:hypothetical protein